MSLALTHARRRNLIGHPVARLVGSSPNRSALWVVLMCAVGLLAFTLVGAVAAAIWLIAWFGQFAGALPPPDQLTARAPFQTTPVMADDNSTVLYEITDPQGGRRTIIKLSQMPRTLVEATIATEDAGFFSNPGFEVRAIFRAFVEDLTHQQLLSGASTITQQVARNVLLTPEERLDRSGRRKVKEIILAYQLTQTYTKDQILSVYLNEIFYGNHSYGVEAAAETYFGKSAAQLDLAQSAMLAGIPQAPSYYDPYQNPDAVKARQSYVLQRMVDQGYITSDQASAASAEPLHFLDRQRAPIAPHFVNYVSDLLQSQLGVDRLYHGGDHAISTLDVPLQTIAERAVTSNPTVAAQGSGTNAALVAIDPRDGHVIAMVGSANYDDPAIAGEVNMALAPRQSTGILNPFTYALALSHGQTLLSSVIDEPLQSAQGTDLLNSTPDPHHYLGPVTLRQAIGLGLAAPALQVLNSQGSQSLIDLMTRSEIANFSQAVDYTPSLLVAGARVSPLEVAQAYAMLADGGTAHRPVVIDRVVDPNGKIVLQTKGSASSALPSGVAYLMTNALADPSVRPADVQSALNLDRPVAFHAAISDDRRDSWAAGYFPNLAVAVWVGSTNGKPLGDVQASTKIWASFIRDSAKSRPLEPYTRPSDVTDVTLCANPGCTSKRTDVVLKGTEQIAEQANAAEIGKPRGGITDSQTPLVDRARTSQSTVQNGTIAATGPVTVPDLSGIRPDQARLRILTAGLANATIVNYVSGQALPPSLRKIAPGSVVGSSPAAGDQAAPGTTIVLTVRSN